MERGFITHHFAISRQRGDLLTFPTLFFRRQAGDALLRRFGRTRSDASGRAAMLLPGSRRVDVSGLFRLYPKGRGMPHMVVRTFVGCETIIS